MIQNIRWFLAVLIATCSFPTLAQENIDAAKMEKIIAMPQSQILDVRTSNEYVEGHIPNALNADWREKEKFVEAMKTLDKDEPVYVYCLGGGRSKQAAKFLSEKGYKVYDYSGGMMDWRNAEKPEIKTANTKESKELSIEELGVILKSTDLVLLNFSAEWCAPCQELKPIIEKIEKDQANKLKVVKIDADQNRELMKVLNVKGIPQLTLYFKGEEVWKNIGILSETEILNQIKKVSK